MTNKLHVLSVQQVESSLRPMRVKKPARKVLQYKRADYNDIRDELSTYLAQFTEETANCSVNDSWTLFERKLQGLISKYIPSKMISGNKIHKPWITQEVKSLHRKRNKLHAKQKASDKPKDKRRYQQARSITGKRIGNT